MKDGKQRNIDQIKMELENKGMILDRDYNTNHLSGTLNRLKTQGHITCLKRGIYQSNKEASQQHSLWGNGLYSLFDLAEDIEEENKDTFAKLRDEIRDDFMKSLKLIKEKVSEVNGLEIMEMEKTEKDAFDWLTETKRELEKLLGEQK